MDENIEGVCGERASEVDRISNLPESLLCEIFLNLPTKVVVKTSALSTRWRNLWKDVPALDLDIRDFQKYDLFVSFMDSFLGFNSDSSLQRCKLYYYMDNKVVNKTRWINNVLERNVQRLHIESDFWQYNKWMMPQTLYTCESLVSLKLYNDNILSVPKFISLPFVKDIELSGVRVANFVVFEKLISSCPLLESIIINSSYVNDLGIFRVCSRSLRRFTYIWGYYSIPDKLEVAIDAPRLEYLRLVDHRNERLRIKNSGSLVEAHININFNIRGILDSNDVPNRNMILDFLVGISRVKKLVLSRETLMVISDYLKYDFPIFHNLSSLHVDFGDKKSKLLPTFLKNCPNLKSLVAEFRFSHVEEEFRVSSIPRCLLSSLEYVEIKWSGWEVKDMMNIVIYFLKNSTILKKLTLCSTNFSKEGEPVVLRELLTIPRLSTSCQVLVHLSPL